MNVTTLMAADWPMAVFFCSLWIAISLIVCIKSRNVVAQGGAAVLAVLMVVLIHHVLVMHGFVS